MSSWSKEFPADFKPPTEILGAPGIVDCSWGNDVCPSFTTIALQALPEGPDGPRDIRLWSDHPDEKMREMGGHSRFSVVDHDKGQCRWEGEDPAQGVMELRKWSERAVTEANAEAVRKAAENVKKTIEGIAEDQAVMYAMVSLGGSFVAALGNAALRADPDNLARLKVAFPDYWARYADIARQTEESK